MSGHTDGVRVVNGAIEDSMWAGVLLGATERLVPAWLAVGSVAISSASGICTASPDGPVA
ncbi:hypothetical protein [Aeromicrobium sp. PE09-221]|uniref:hypothetical protein n=1 Tax=Aeromicrobium sp. PE09-221 TaxID=1898043 RepID=UPI00111CA089|nr:hypothetical protein [Aeromicrobium sp. PE09-221]